MFTRWCEPRFQSSPQKTTFALAIVIFTLEIIKSCQTHASINSVHNIYIGVVIIRIKIYSTNF